jgi:hypothetical protein
MFPPGMLKAIAKRSVWVEELAHVDEFTSAVGNLCRGGLLFLGKAINSL